MAYHYHMNDPLGKGPLLNEQGNVANLGPWSRERNPWEKASAGWRTSTPHENYNGRYLEVLKNVPLDPLNRISAFAEFLFLPNQGIYYKFHSESMPRYLANGVSFVSLSINQDDTPAAIKRKFTKLSKCNDVVAINPRSVCPLIHKLIKPGGDPEGLLPLLDRIVTVSERNLNSPPGCTIL